MFEDGLENEVKFIIRNRRGLFGSQAMQAIGYKEFEDYFDGLLTKRELVDLI